jgi:CRP/FNR family transcriptional regulator, cyclic AMP receptor protein
MADVATHNGTALWGAEPEPQVTVRLLEVLPQLAEHLDPEQAEQARQAIVAPVVSLGRGAWDRGEIAARRHNPFGGIVLSGLLARHIDIGGYPGLDLHGPGDFLGARELRRATLPCGEAWCATVRSQVAVLDDRFLLAARRWPRLVTGLFTQMQEQHDRLLLQLVVAEQPRVEDRLLLLFWQLSDRFGKVTPEGIAIRLSLTHEALGRLIGARRPTVSLALRTLGERGALVRRADRSWLVREWPDDVAVTATGLTAGTEPRPLGPAE